MWRGSLGIENCFTKADNQSRQTTPTFTKLTFQSQPAVQFVSIKIYFLDWSALPCPGWLSFSIVENQDLFFSLILCLLW